MVSRVRRDEGGDRRIDTHHIARFVGADIADDNRRLIGWVYLPEVAIRFVTPSAAN